NYFIERDLGMASIAVQGELCGINCFYGSHGVSFDTRDLHKASNWVTCEAKVMFHGDFACHHHLCRSSTHDFCQGSCSHGGGDANFSLTSTHGCGNGGSFFEETANFS